MGEQHTPEPWVLDGHNLSAVIHCTVPKGHPDAKHLCGDYETVAIATGPRWRADAILIAAAPSLLAALKEARQTILDLKNARGSEAEGADEEWIADIDAAIAKATQET